MINKMGKDEDTAIGILLGLLGLAVLAKILEKKCPICTNVIPAGRNTCPYCGYVINQ